MRYLRNITSLNNLNKNNLSGQIATILVLIMVAVLIFILVTINIGRVTTKTTQLAIAADSSALLLGSQLATYAHMLAEQLGDDEVCVKGGILPTLLSILGSLIAGITGQWYIIPMIIGGAVGGAIGGAIVQGSLEGAAMGALQGAAIGAALYGGMAVGYGASAGVSLSSAMQVLPVAATIGAHTLGIVIGGAFVAGASIYNASISDKMKVDAMDSIIRQLNGLPEYDSLRESIFLHAFQQVIDDPNEEPDEYDLDRDTDYTEMVPVFQNWWYEHIDELKASFASGAGLIDEFLRNDLIPFYQHLKEFLPNMDRRDIECGNCSTAGSPLEELFRAIVNCGYDFFWKEGPNQDELVAWYQDGSPNTIPPEGSDEFDGLRREYEEFIDYADALLEIDECGWYNYDPDDLDKDNDWIDILYDPENSGEFYDVLLAGAIGSDYGEKGIQQWMEQIRDVREQLPGCQLAYTSLESENGIERVEPYCQEYNPEEAGSIYPCNWESVQEELSGTYIPNPLCKLYAPDKTTLYNEIETVEDVVNNLEARISASIEASHPCGIGQSGVLGCWLESVDNITITGVCLEGNIHSPCDRSNLGTGQATISYSYSYDYTCKCCVANDCCTVNPCCSLDIDGNCVSCCVANECCTQNTTTYQGQIGSTSETIAAPDLNIPCMDRSSFLNVLSSFRTTLNNDVPDTFATIDKDFDDEFVDVLDLLEEEYNILSDFLDRLKDFYDNYQALKNTGRSPAENTGGTSPAYTWTDTEGTHSVIVQVGAARLPEIKKEEDDSWLGLVTKTCWKVSYPDSDKAWVKITRQDPGQKEIASSGEQNLGFKWNPFFGANQTITRKARASYGHNSVGINDVSGNFPGE